MVIYYVGFPLLLLAAIFDATLMTLLRIWGGSPNLVLMVVVSWALLVDLREALPWAVMGGILRDLLSIAPTGSSALALVLIVLVVDRFFPKLDWHNVIVAPLVVAIATFTYDFILAAILILAGRPIPSLQTITYVIVPNAVLNVFLIAFVFRSIGWFNHFLRPARETIF